MTNTKSYIIVHAGRRDDYQMALALHEHGQLFCLVTEAYFPLDCLFFNKVVSFLGIKKKLNLRFKEGLPSKKVIVSYSAFVFRIIVSAY